MFVDVKKLKNRVILAFSAAFAVLSLATVIYYIIYPSAAYLHADCTDTILWAKASYDGKAMFNEDFGYAAMLPFGGTTLMIPLIGIFGLSMTTQHIGMILFSVLFFASAFFLCRSLNFSYSMSFSAVGTLALVLCSSEKLREIFYEHVIYYSIAVLIVFVLLSLFIRFHRAFKSDISLIKLVTITLGTVVFSICSALDGTQIIATGILPVIFAAAAEIMLSKERKLLSKGSRISIYFCLICGVSMIIGLWLLSIFSNGVTAGYAGAYTSYSNMNEWLGNLGKFPEQWFDLFGVDAHYGMSIFSPESIVNIVRIGSAAVIAIVPLVALFFYNKFDFASKLLVLAHFGMSAVIMFGYVFGILAAANWRLSPMICTGILVCFAVFRLAKEYVVPARLMTAVLCVLILMSGISFASVAKMEKNGIEHNEKYPLVQVLEEHGFTHGYATFWNSQVITLLSDNEVSTANVDINENGIAPCPYQTNMNQFLPQAGVEEYFVLMSDYEMSILQQTDDWVYFEVLAKDIISIDGYKIFVFNSLFFLS
ncbi:MAG: hypothetical protein IJE72_01570 [Clostridia bacterium]|nr:hypothetical protein [Clostridia bacterium]